MIALVVLGSMLPGAGPAAAQSDARGRLSLASQTAWVGAGDRFELRVDLSGVRRPEALEVVVAVYESVTSRSQFSRTLDGRLLGRELLRLGPTSLAEVGLDAAGALPFAIDIGGTADIENPDQPSLDLDGAGVHPVRVELRQRDGAGEVDGLTTYLVRTRDDDAGPLAVAWLQDIEAPLALEPNGDVVVDPTAWSDIAVVVQALSQSDVTLTLAPRPETLDALADRSPDLLNDLVAARAGRQVLAAPYVEVDPAALFAAGLGDVVEAEWQRGTATITDTLGEVDTTTLFTDRRLQPATLVGLEEIKRLVVPEATFGALDRPLTLANPFLVEDSAGRQLRAAAVDPGLSSHFDAGDDPVLGAHQLLADLAVLSYDAPGLTRGVVVAPPPGWRPDPEFLAAALPALADSPVVDDVAVEEIFDDVPLAREPSGDPLIRLLQADPVADTDLAAAELRRSRADVASVRTMVGADSPTVELLDRLSLVSAAAGLSPERRAEYHASVDQAVDDELDAVDILSEGSFQLTSRQATVPLTLVNDSETAVEVTLDLASDKLEFVDAETGRLDTGATARSLTLAPGRNPVMVPVEARASGDFPLDISVRSPDGRLLAANTRLTVRSTFPSGVGILLSVSAGAFLALWWGRHWRTSKRDRRLRAPDSSDEPTPT